MAAGCCWLLLLLNAHRRVFERPTRRARPIHPGDAGEGRVLETAPIHFGVTVGSSARATGRTGARSDGQRSLQRRDVVPRPYPLRRAELAPMTAVCPSPGRVDGRYSSLPTLRHAPVGAMTGEVIVAALVANDRRPRGVWAIAGVVLQGAAMVAAVLEVELAHLDARRTGAAHRGGGYEGRTDVKTTS